MFHAPNANDAGTHLIRNIDIAPAFLVERFGPPLPGDGYKCTGRYKFVAKDRSLFTLYDYKSTAAYLGEECNAPTPEQFWRRRDPQQMSIGGRGEYGDESADTFAEWLLAEYSRWRTAHQEN